MTERDTAMELEYAREMVRLIEEFFAGVPKDVLIGVLEREIARKDAVIGDLADLHADAVFLAMQKEAWLQNKWIERGRELTHLQGTHQRLIQSMAVQAVAGRKDVRDIEGDHDCAANSDQGEAFGYCGQPAVAQVLVSGTWRPICQSHLERLPSIERRRV